MAEPKRFDVSLDVSTGRDRSPAAPRREDPFLLLVIGDFSGREASGEAAARPLAERRPVAVDRDDIDEVLARFAPGARIERSDGVAVELTFREMEDFHPDRIFRRASFFQALREARQRAREPQGGQGLIGALLGEPIEAATPRSAPATPDADTNAAADAVLERIIDGPPSRARTADPLQAFLRGIVTPHLVPGRDPGREAILAELDAGTVRLLRDVLHAPAFRRLERLWRGIDFLVRRTETSPALKILLLDATAAELRADLAAHEENGEPGLGRALREAAAGTGIAAIVTDITLKPDVDDFALLRGLTRVAVEHGAALLAGASPRLAGLANGFATMPDSREAQPWPDDAWHAFRRSPEAAGVGLALPRFLLRIPYGEEGEECESLRFEETEGPPGHEDYLWGNPAFACAVLLGQEFAASGWTMRPGMHRDIAGLPLHSFRGPDGPELKPCAECTMSDDLAEALMEMGLMVLASVKHGDVARLVRFQSIASPLTALRGPWSRSV